MSQRILVAVDGKEQSPAVIEEVIKLSLAIEEIVIHLLYVTDYDRARREVLHAVDQQSLEQQRRERLKPLEQQLKEANLRYEISFTHGNPAMEILRFADEIKAEMIVVGHRNLGRMGRLLMGSVSREVVHRSTRPVLVVK